ncbi:hypothetical protein [Sinorhizobium meliloti]|nr:hypothetical protein [Sinorhizobium meliloti]
MGSLDREIAQQKHDSAGRWALYNGTVFCSPTAKMDLLYDQLAAQGIASEGMTWRLLILEWKYDLTVLSINLRDWMRSVDQRFDRSRKRP